MSLESGMSAPEACDDAAESGVPAGEAMPMRRARLKGEKFLPDIDVESSAARSGDDDDAFLLSHLPGA